MSADSRTDPLLRLRHELHTYPELSGHEQGTAARIAAFLGALAPDRLCTGVGGAGVIATFDSGRPGPVLLVRCELDALPIDEGAVAGRHRSTSPGVAHKCGHDGHMAMVGGLAAALAEQRTARGAVHVLYQPAEETGAGAAAVLADPAFADLHPRPTIGVALHNLPGFPLHAVVLKPGPVTPAVRSIVVRLTGRAAHASEPANGSNPALAVADLLRAAAAESADDPDLPGYRLATVIHVRIGSPAYGVSPGDAEVHLTLRERTDAGLAALQQALVAVATEAAARDDLRVQVDTVEDFAATVNDAAVTEVVARAAANAGLAVVRPAQGMRPGEDFGLFSRRFPSCLVLLGAGEEHPPLHDPDYDFPDALIGTGVALLRGVLDEVASSAPQLGSGK